MMNFVDTFVCAHKEESWTHWVKSLIGEANFWLDLNSGEQVTVIQIAILFVTNVHRVSGPIQPRPVEDRGFTDFCYF